MGTTGSDELSEVAVDAVFDCFCPDGCHAVEASGTESGRVRAEFHHAMEGRLARVLLDTGAGLSYVSKLFVCNQNLLNFFSKSHFSVSEAFGDKVKDNKLPRVAFIFSDIQFSVVCRVAPLSSYDLILGRDWISSSVASTDWHTNTWFLHGAGGKVVPFCLNLPLLYSVMTHKLAVMTDEDKVLLTRHIRRHEFYEGA
jgi:hypothetical protein